MNEAHLNVCYGNNDSFDNLATSEERLVIEWKICISQGAHGRFGTLSIYKCMILAYQTQDWL